MKRLAVSLAAIAALVFAAGASAHAVVSPPVAVAKELQQFTLSVPGAVALVVAVAGLVGRSRPVA